MKALSSTVSSLVIVAAATAIGGVGSYWLANESAVEVRRTPVTGDREQLVLVFFGSSTCGVCLRPETIAAIPEVRVSVARLANDAGLDFVSIGVGLEYDHEAGIGYLNRLGMWDQISVGLEQLNSVALHTLPVYGTPDVMVLRRNVTVSIGTLRATSLAGQRILVHKTGLVEIRRWLALGTPIPGLEAAIR